MKGPKGTCSVTTTVRDAPSIDYCALARDALGTTWDVSFVICGDTRAQKLNATYRNKTYTPNVLSFPLSATSGEVVINVREAEREAKRLNVPARERIVHLAIHGLLHLRGMDHGVTMERTEARLLKRFSIHPQGLVY
jgi:probable rRNA maturation factor